MCVWLCVGVDVVPEYIRNPFAVKWLLFFLSPLLLLLLVLLALLFVPRSPTPDDY